ncbi:Hsp70 family protein [Nocardia stercoris]|uniref:Hsp70 family protein n=1 Tax=Nocardia stercoris TaxID=2483361 RepID=UPI00131A34DC|nr:Hsp70 family protein [Nocardia stercoris]
MIGCTLAADEPADGPVATYPACYTERQVSALRHALDWSGSADVLLMPEPVAAVEWLDEEFELTGNGLTLVYDLGATSLDVAVVRTEECSGKRGLLGSAVRSHEFGGRPLGAVLARYARALAPGTAGQVSKIVPAQQTTRLRSWHIRNSLKVVRRCVAGAGLELSDIDRVLLVGAATRPPEVADVLAELGRPVVMSSDPGHTAAVGAALAAARMADFGSNFGRYARGAAVVSGAAVASALAVSAVSMIGGGPIGTDGPAIEFAPVLAGPGQGHHSVSDLLLLDGTRTVPGLPSTQVRLDALAGPWRTFTGVAQAVSEAVSADIEHSVAAHGPGTHCDPPQLARTTTYADPANFVNPLPFQSGSRIGGTPGAGGSTPFIGPIPTVSLPGGHVPGLPGEPSTGGNGNSGTPVAVPISEPGPDGGTANGGASTGGGTAPGSGASAGGGSTGGGTSTGGSTSGGGATGGASSTGGSDGTGASGGAGGSTGGAASGGTQGGSTGGGTGGSTDSGGSTGGTGGSTGTGGGSTSGSGGSTSDTAGSTGGSGGSTGDSEGSGGSTGGTGGSGGTTGGTTNSGGTSTGTTGGSGNTSTGTTSSTGGTSTGGGTTGGTSNGGGTSTGGSTSGGGTTGGTSPGGGTTHGGATGGGMNTGGMTGGGMNTGGMHGGGLSGGGAPPASHPMGGLGTGGGMGGSPMGGLTGGFHK